MYDELTQIDIQKMQEELDDRLLNVDPMLLEEVKRCREFGDLSENFEYREAKRTLNRNRSRIRYLQNMIKTARVIEDHSAEDEVGLYDDVEVYMSDIDEVEHIRLTTTIRTAPGSGFISKESPLGKAVLGKRVGDRVEVRASEDYVYEVEIRSIKKSEDDGTAPMLSY